MTPEGLYAIAARVWDVHARGRSDWRGIEREDAIQAAVTRAWRKRDQWDPRFGAESTFYSTIMLHEIAQHAKVERNRRPQLLPPEADSIYEQLRTHPDALDEVELQEELHQVLMVLSGRDRAIVEMRLAGLTNAEVAVHVGLHPVYVAALVRQSVERVRTPC